MRISKKIAMTWFLTGILLIAALCNCKIVGSQHPNGKNEKVHGSNENIILENQVDHSRFVGISVGIHIPANNVFISSQRNAITGNEIVYSGISSADQSGIYVGGHGRPGADLTSNWITENRVLQSIGSMRTAIENVAGIEHKGVDGIFLDDYSSGNLVQRNIVSNSSRSSIHINMGAKNRIYQNILASDTDSSVHTNLGAEENEFYGNHVIDLAAQPASKVWSNDSGTSQMGFNRIDGNLYWLRGRDPSWPDTFSGFSPIGTFRQWRSTGTFDLNSRYVTDNLGVVISPDRVVLGNASCSWAAANGYGPSFGILTGLRRFVAQRNDLSATCINSLFGNQYSPNFNVNPVSVYKCLVP